jgi:putative flippase GtrA
MGEFFTQAFLLKFIKFGVVGVTGVGVDFGTTYTCKEWIRIQKYISNSIGFTIAASTNYILNRVWTFRSQDPNIVLEYSEFLMISILGLGINNLILWIIHSKFKKNFYLSKLFAIGVVTIWNFLANYFITFAK